VVRGVDWRNLDPSDIATVNVYQLLGGQGQPSASAENVTALTEEIAAHELGHLSGLRHSDAFGPIGGGIYAGVNPSAFSPAYPGPVGANETALHIMASPASLGTSLLTRSAARSLGSVKTSAGLLPAGQPYLDAAAAA